MRSSGILLPVSALPGKYGIGTMGKSAYSFVDFLCNSCQHYWQILPLGHTGYADSPYQCFSAFAGNPYLIDPTLLFEDGLLCENELPSEDNSNFIDYGELYNTRIKIIKKAAQKINFSASEYLMFKNENRFWLEDYALFMSVKEKKRMCPLKKWKEEMRCPDEETVERLKQENHDELQIWCAIQYLFYYQWNKLKKYANLHGIEIIGDVPIYVSADSCELWLHPELFITDDDYDPSLVSGCPPDKFSPLGQLWGNPLYDWTFHKKTDYSWWISRLRHSKKIYDVVRIDHFRGFEDFYAVDARASNAAIGEWYKGPSNDFIKALKQKLPDIRVIAEDLGNITDEVRTLLRYSGYPGMKILQFAFDDVCDNEFLPHNYARDCFAYTGTHDNPTMKQWAAIADDKSFSFAKKYLGVNNADCFVNDCIRNLFASVSDTVIIPFQDWLELGAQARMNVPSIADGNWKWRASETDFSDILSERIRKMTELYFRDK